MRTLVTGGAGFIGSTLVDRLIKDGNDVDVVDDLSTGSTHNLESASESGAMTFHELDIRTGDLEALMFERRPEVVFHLAAQISVGASVTSPVFDSDVNVLGSVRVIDAARVAGTRKVVFAASGGTLYGDVPIDELPLDEHHPHRPRSPYGLAKMVACQYLELYRELFGLEYTALALANVFGPRQDPHGEAGVVAIFARNLVAGRSSNINGDGHQTRDFVYVDDVVDAFVRAMSGADGKLLNIGTGIQTSVNQLYTAMAGQVDGAQQPIHVAAKPGEVMASALSGKLAGVELGWSPTGSLDAGVAKVIEYERHRS